MDQTAQLQSEARQQTLAAAHHTICQNPGVAMVDNRPTAIVQCKLVGAIHQSPRLTAQRDVHSRIHSSLQMVAERNRLERMFGHATQRKGIPEEELQMKAPPACTPVVQHKKTTKPADKELIDKFTVGHNLPSAVLAGKVTDSDKGDAIWTHLTAIYNTNKDNGQRYWGELTKAITDYKDVDKKASVVGGNTGKRTGYDSRFGSNYSNTVEGLGGTNYRVNTQGYDSVKPVVPTGQYKGNYSNEFDVAGGAIKAAWNFGASKDRDTGVISYDDEALEVGKGLNNSEVLWQQYQLAASQHFSGDLDQANKVQQAMKNITTIKRDTVINDETQETVYVAYPDGKKWGDEDKVWRPNQEEFMAVLGTPNARSSPHFLKDHLDQIEKTIDKITTTSAEGIDIDFAPI
jgi:hypothetical protein